MRVVTGSTNGPPRILDWPPPDAPSEASLRRGWDLLDRLAGEVVLRHVPGRRVLDLGHGAPAVTQWVEPRAARQDVVDAVDLGHDAEVRLGLPDASFDVVYSLRTIPHLGHDEASGQAATQALLAEVGRILVPGGTALVQIENARSFWQHPEDRQHEFTRHDTLHGFLRLLPEVLDMTRFHGLRVVAGVPGWLRVPGLGRLLERLEWRLRDRTVLRALAAHLLLVLRRVPKTT